ncbi:hypothetical protein BDW59DRAFT_149090 [Aspergillus cavernicola]|uniref:Uncharacterized protein n=1 Tax=Aspergillus cavernicola TaxID=176166 RepID=A0ABR4I630_9EURO
MDQLCMHRLWFLLVSKATTADKTGGDPAKRLGALAGLALAIGGKEYQHNYKRGLWKRHLLFDLLWFIQSGHTTRPQEPHSPSWLWAAVSGAVSQQLMIDEKGFTGKRHVIVHTATVISGPESAEAADEGLLVLKCPVLRAVNLTNAESHYYTVEVQSAHGGVQARFAPDTVDFDQCRDFVVAEIVREVVYEPGGQDRVSEVWSNGLVLRQVREYRGSGGPRIVFMRVGRFWMRWPVYWSSFLRGVAEEDRVFGNGIPIRVV